MKKNPIVLEAVWLKDDNEVSLSVYPVLEVNGNGDTDDLREITIYNGEKEINYFDVAINLNVIPDDFIIRVR